MLVLADLAAGPVLVGLGGVGLLITGLVVLSEAVVLTAFLRTPFLRSLWMSLAVNVASALPGLLAATLSASFSKQVLDLTPPTFGIMIMVPAWAATVALEGPMLRAFTREPWPRVWKATVLMNLVSYALLIGAIVSLEKYT